MGPRLPALTRPGAGVYIRESDTVIDKWSMRSNGKLEGGKGKDELEDGSASDRPARRRRQREARCPRCRKFY